MSGLTASSAAARGAAGLLVALATGAGIGCGRRAAATDVAQTDACEARVTRSTSHGRLGPYPDYVEAVPTAYAGPTFVLRQDYPRALPAAQPTPWLRYNFRSDPDGYLLAVREYFYVGMRDVDFRAERDTTRQWFHMPWMHVGPNGREAVHGLTRERTSQPLKLDSLQMTPVQNWGIGFYNAVGAYTLGRVWADPKQPKPQLSQFAPGTVVTKLLFTAATPQQVPWIDGAYQLLANVNATTDPPDSMRRIEPSGQSASGSSRAAKRIAAPCDTSQSSAASVRAKRRRRSS